MKRKALAPKAKSWGPFSMMLISLFFNFFTFFYFLLVWDVWWRSVTDPVAGVGCIGCLRETHTERERERGGERERWGITHAATNRRWRGGCGHLRKMRNSSTTFPPMAMAAGAQFQDLQVTVSSLWRCRFFQNPLMFHGFFFLLSFSLSFSPSLPPSLPLPPLNMSRLFLFVLSLFLHSLL